MKEVKTQVSSHKGAPRLLLTFLKLRLLSLRSLLSLKMTPFHVSSLSRLSAIDPQVAGQPGKPGPSTYPANWRAS